MLQRRFIQPAHPHKHRQFCCHTQRAIVPLAPTVRAWCRANGGRARRQESEHRKPWRQQTRSSAPCSPSPCLPDATEQAEAVVNAAPHVQWTTTHILWAGDAANKSLPPCCCRLHHGVEMSASGQLTTSAWNTSQWRPRVWKRSFVRLGCCIALSRRRRGRGPERRGVPGPLPAARVQARSPRRTTVHRHGERRQRGCMWKGTALAGQASLGEANKVFHIALSKFPADAVKWQTQVGLGNELPS